MKKQDSFLLVLFPVVAISTTTIFQLNYFWAILLFLGLPAFWLSWQERHLIKRVALFSVILNILLTILDYVAVQSGSWYVPTTVFPFRLLGSIPLEDLIFGFFLVYTPVIFYEHFFGESVSTNIIGKKMKCLLWPLAGALVGFSVLLVFYPGFLKIKYAYSWTGVLFFDVPILTGFLIYPRLISKFLKTNLYFITVLTLFEYAVVSLDYCNFPSNNFINWVQIFGHTIPIEELLYVTISIIAILSYYEIFDGNEDIRRDANRL